MEDISPDELGVFFRQRGIRLFIQAFTARDIKAFELLRNNLAHGQAITMQNWISIIRLSRRIYEILKQ